MKILQWTPPQPPSGLGEGKCPYDHCTAETPFGKFLITWKSWNPCDLPTVDETPWGDWFGAFDDVEAAQQACEDEYRKRLQAALGQLSPEGELTDEGLAAIAADRARRPAPEPPAEGEVAELVDQLAGDQEMKIYRLPDLNGTIDSSKSSVPQPVPVSERLPGPEDCLDEGWAWFFNPRTGWRQATQPVHTGYTHWLPAHALPLPSTEHS